MGGQSIRKKIRKTKPDYSFLISSIVIAVVGLLTLLSASAPKAIASGYSNYYYVKKQVSIAIIGVVFAIVVYNIDFVKYKKLFVNKTTMYIVYAILLALTLSVKFFGQEGKGAIRWIRLGPIMLQPSELVKVGLIYFIAAYSTIAIEEGYIKKFWKGIMLPLVLVGILLGLTFKVQNHLSASLLMLGTSLTQLVVAGVSLKYLATISLASITIFVTLMSRKVKSGDGGFRASRVKVWRNPFEYIKTMGWQTVQSLYALASGGFLGAGIGESRQKLSYLPEAQNDFIFSVFAEETGFVGVFFVIVLFAFFVARGFLIANSAEDTFSRLLATGVITILTLQIIGNLAVVSNTIPVTGISLPFFSYGGTAIIVNIVEVAILLNISKQNKN